MATQADPRQRGTGRGAANLLALGLAGVSVMPLLDDSEGERPPPTIPLA